MTEIAQKQKDLALEAEAYPNGRIWGLFPMICEEEWMAQAMWKVIHNKGAVQCATLRVFADFYPLRQSMTQAY